MKKRLLQIVSAFIMIAMIIPMIGTSVKAATRAQDLFNYLFANGRDISFDDEAPGNTYSCSTFSDDSVELTMVYGHKDKNDIWLSYSEKRDNAAMNPSFFFIYDIPTDSITSCLISLDSADGKNTLISADGFTKSFEPGAAFEFLAISDEVAFKNEDIFAIAGNAMLKLNAFLNTMGFNMGDLGFTSQKFATSSTPATPVTPAPTAKPTPTPTSAPLPDFDPNASGESGVSGFVDRLYTVVLGRDAEKEGKKYWSDELSSRTQDGATAAFGFLTSEEFINKHYDDKSFVEILYRLFFGRNSDKDGMAYWTGELKNGQSREWVISGFVNSTEWANICVEYGIKSGGTGVPTTNFKPNKKVTDFASRLYTTCLGRDAEKAGLEYWAGELANMRTTGTTAAQGFFFSEEFTKAKYNDKEFINRLYKTFMGREADQAGFDYWLGEMKNGATRETVFFGFANAPEFAKLCADAGIINN